MPLFYNDNIIIESNYVYDSIMYTAGIRYIKDILNENGNFENWNETNKLTNNKTNFLRYYGLLNSVKSFLSKHHILIQKKFLNKCHNPSINCYFFQILTKKEINKHIYNKLIGNRETPSCRVKWNSIYNDLEIDWNLVHGSVFKCTRDT